MSNAFVANRRRRSIVTAAVLTAETVLPLSNGTLDSLAAHEFQPLTSFEFHSVIKEDAIQKGNVFEMAEANRRPANNHTPIEFKVFPACPILYLYKDSAKAPGH
jgi:hypothetical protein